MGWDYCAASSVKEASDILLCYKGMARIIAGGTDLMLDLQEKKKKVQCLVDISKVPELQEIAFIDDMLSVGAGVTFTETAKNQLCRRNAAVLVEAAESVGSPQIRNIATVAGNVVNAQPAADAAVALMALEAKVQISGSSGIKVISMEDCYLSLGSSGIDSAKELVTSIRFKPLETGQGSAFVRFAHRGSLALPILNVAVVVTLQGDCINEARIVLAPAGPMPFRAKAAEAFLISKAPETDVLLETAKRAASEAPFRDSQLRGSKEYRRNLACVLAHEALEKAVTRARETISTYCRNQGV